MTKVAMNDMNHARNRPISVLLLAVRPVMISGLVQALAMTK